METVAREDSSSIESLRYDEQTGQLYIKFKRGGGEHVFHDVPSDVYEEFSSASSWGQFFHRNIRRRFRTNKV